jgi:imidazolonepropionase-like amidohydrolase
MKIDMLTNSAVFFGLVCLLSCGASGINVTWAQDEPDEKPVVGQPAEKETEKETDKPSKDIIAVVGADIITVTRETLRGGTILIEDGKISAIGNNVEVPKGATVVEAGGKTIVPGFVAIDMARVGLSSSSDRNAKYSDSLDPFDRNISLSLAVGITSGCLEIRSGGGGRFRRAPDEDFPVTERFPGLDPDLHSLANAPEEKISRDYGEFISVCPCCGLPILPTEPITPSSPSPVTPQKNVVVKMSFGKLEGMLVTENAFLDITPGSLSGALNKHKWRDQLAKARKYLEDQAAHEKAVASGKKEQPPRKPVTDEILKLVKGEIALRISADAVADIRDMVELSQELDYRLVVAGAGEAWVIADEIAAADTSLIITPRRRRRPTFGEEDRSGTWIETPRVLEETGVPFAVSALSNSISMVGLAGRDLTSLPLEAAFAVRGGASERKALAAITITPAQMLGLGDRIGSLEVGKDADLLLLNGPPLDYRTYVETAFVNGRIVYQRDRDRVLPVF